VPDSEQDWILKYRAAIEQLPMKPQRDSLMEKLKQLVYVVSNPQAQNRAKS